MAPRNKFLSPTCAPDLGNIDTYFFFEKYFDLTSEYVLQWRHFWVLLALRIRFFFQKNSWRVLHHTAQLFTYALDFVMCGEEHANYFFLKSWILRHFSGFPVTSEHPKMTPLQHTFRYQIEMFFQKKKCVDIS